MGGKKQPTQAMNIPRCLRDIHGDLMTGVFMVRPLPPWFENLGKRQVKAPKVEVVPLAERVEAK